MANAQRQPAAATSPPKEVGYVAGDLQGPFAECDMGPFRGAKYNCMWRDLGVGLIGLYFLRTKAGAFRAIKRFEADARSLRPDYRLHTLRTDLGREFVNRELDDWCTEKGILKTTVGGENTPNQSFVEQHWRAIGRIVRAGLSQSKLAYTLWPYLALHAMHVLNCIGRDGGKCAIEILSGKPSKLAVSLRPIGCRAYALKTQRELLAAGSAKVSERAWAGINLGLAPWSPGYMILIPETGTLACAATIYASIMT